MLRIFTIKSYKISPSHLHPGDCPHMWLLIPSGVVELAGSTSVMDTGVYTMQPRLALGTHQNARITDRYHQKLYLFHLIDDANFLDKPEGALYFPTITPFPQNVYKQFHLGISISHMLVPGRKTMLCRGGASHIRAKDIPFLFCQCSELS